MLVVSVAFVRLHANSRHRHDDKGETKTYWGYTLNHARLACMKHYMMYFAALLISSLAVYSGKYFSSGTYKATMMQEMSVRNEKKMTKTNLRQFTLENTDLVGK